MASQDGGSSFNLKLDLLERGPEFSFFQALRLLNRLAQKKEKNDQEEGGRVKVRPHLSLAFPAADIAKIEENSGEPVGFTVIATFLGLYGTSSPLPTFYTEDLLAEAAEEESVSRDFIDIINQRLYTLLFRCWLKYRQFLKVVEEGSSPDLERLFCLLGLGEAELREHIESPYVLLRYLGLFTQFPRSALGLQTLVRDFLAGVDTEVWPGQLRKAKIPAEQRSYLGLNSCTLGENIYIGEEIADRMGKFLLKIGPLAAEKFHSLLPGSPIYERLIFLINLYLAEPFEFDLELILAKGEMKTVCLGNLEWSRLGLDTWVFSGEGSEEGRAKINRGV